MYQAVDNISTITVLSLDSLKKTYPATTVYTANLKGKRGEIPNEQDPTSALKEHNTVGKYSLIQAIILKKL